MWLVSKRSALAALAAIVALAAPAAAQTPPAPRAPASRLPAAEMAVSPAASLRPGGQAPAADTSRGRLSAPQMAGRSRAPVVARTDDSLVKAIEQQLRCTCGCNLDVYTCRTTDFTCATSPAMHRVLLARLDSGMTAAQVIAAFQKVIDDANAGLARFEAIKKFRLLGQPFTLEGGELTPTLKVKRRFVEKRYGDMLKEMYSEPAPKGE